MPIGIVSEPGREANEFKFITPDDEKLKTGEFVYYNVSLETEDEDSDLFSKTHKIFARVINRDECRGYPDSFLADPEVNPKHVAKKLGVISEDMELYRMTAKIIGYYDTRLNDFTNPRIVPKSGTKVELAPDDDLEKFLTNIEDVAEAFIGDLLHRNAGAVDIKLPVDNFTSTHLSILASTGSGKSYTCSVIAEELMKPDSRAAMLILDPHAEYHTLKEIEKMEEFKGNDGYKPKVSIWGPEDIRIRFAELSFREIISSLHNPSDAQEQRLREAWNRIQSSDDYGQYYSVNDLISECIPEDGSDAISDALTWRLRNAFDRELFDHSRNLSISELLEPGRVSILQLDTISAIDQQLIVNILFRKIYRERINCERNRDTQLDFPVFAILEEGHRFAPANGESRSLPILRTILSEGRKFGFGIGVISQRPSKIDDDILSQCKTQIIMQIQNPNDQDAIRRAVESVGEDLLSELPGLTPGQSVVAGDSVNTPFLCKIRERHTTHGAESLKTSKRWRESWTKNAQVPDKVVDADQDKGAEDREELL